ncbi:MAG: LysR family transcriptional regulator [Gammaproteobacteria bacterium]|nr:LysR family transcriptional regulator [Gammaproteobacteria bacterium]
MDIELLKTFLEVNNTRHFGKAAENLYLTQAAVSARIKQLESFIGTPLFTRYRNNLQLTGVGERLLSHAETILIAWERAKSEAKLTKAQKKTLAIGATSGLWELILQDVINEIHSILPEIALRAESFEQEKLIRSLMERTLDLTLLYEPAKITDLISIPVAQTELILASTYENQDLDAAINKNYVSVDWGTSFNVTHAQFFKNINAPVLHTSQAKIALDFILYHGGSAYLPYRLVKKLLGNQLHHIEQAPVINRPMYACYHNSNIHIEVINTVIEMIKNLATPDYLLFKDKID